ncbi:MAG: SulP family inorganic anion transporter [Burkholderiales bacterium]
MSTHAIATPGAGGGLRLVGEIKGGIASALVGLAIALTLGLLAFGALGAEHVDLGVRAAFSTIVFAAPVALLLGGTPIPGAGPRVSSTLILAALIASSAADPSLAASGMPRVDAVVFLAATSLALAGIIQIGFGLARLGTLARFVPYPVVAGFMNGVAILIVLWQIPYLIGLPAPVRGQALLDALPGTQPWTLVVGVATAALVWAIAMRWKAAPAALLALLGGTALYYGIAAILPATELGPRLGEISGALSLPVALEPLGTHSGINLLASHWTAVVGTAAAIAMIGSLDSLLAAAAVDVAHNTTHHPNRELVGLGFGNLVSGAFGGIPVSFSPNLALAAFQAGARTRAAGLVAVAVIAAVCLLGARALAYIPIVVLAGVMVTAGVNLVDRWTRQLVGQLGRGGLGRDTWWSLVVVAAVCVVTVVFHFVVAVTFGLIASMALFIASMNRSLVRASWTGLQRASRRVYPAHQAHRLREKAGEIRILELEGPLFFGTAYRLDKEVKALARSARFIILDFRRAATIDATGAVILEQLSRRLTVDGVRLFLAHVMPEGRHGRMLAQFGTFVGRPRTDWFEDIDRALEAAELGLLADHTETGSGDELPLQTSSLLAGLGPDDCARVCACLDRQELDAGEILFREGEPGDRLYVLTRGSVTITTGVDRKVQRIGTFEPGVIFGEMAMLDGATRSATSVADRPAVVYSLASASLAQLRAADSELGNRLLVNIARHLSNRLRLSTDALRAESDVGD